MNPIRHGRLLLQLAVCLSLCASAPAVSHAQFNSLETDDIRLVYFGPASDYLVRYTARAFENSMAFHRKHFSFSPTERVTVMLHDQSDYGNAGADVLPKDRIVMAMAPLSYTFETSPANERINSTLHHELMHIVVNDKSARRDRFFRGLFSGKVVVDAEDPISILYSYATAPRRYAPRWYQEGAAVFMETWMSGGLGRSLGGYDEMVFRTLVMEDAEIYDPVGLESAGTAVDFQVGVNSYLYGTRFMSYLALTYGPDALMAWYTRTPGSPGHFTGAFKMAFGVTLNQAWSAWIGFERGHQKEAIAHLRTRALSPWRPIAPVALGSVSRTHLSSDGTTLYAAVNFPGQIAHIAAIDVRTGHMRRITDVKGPSLYAVASTAYDPTANRLFFTTDNSGWRDLNLVDLETGSTTLLQKDARIGDLAYSVSDGTLWGVRHHLGFSTVVRMDAPYDRWRQAYTLDYGTDLYDLDVSPDGQHLTGSLAGINGDQRLVQFDTGSLSQGTFEPETLFYFETSNPEGFAYSPDGRHLFGSSYYSGVSNIFRYDLEAEEGAMAIVSNAETGFFRPAPVSADSMIALRFSAQGFQPVMLPIAEASARSIKLLGQRVVEAHPAVTEWMAGSPADVPIDSMITRHGPYNPLGEVGLDSIYPVIQGFKNQVVLGLRFNLSDPIGMYDFSATVSYDPSTALPDDQRLHASLSLRHLGWTATASYNRASFYDLFGPTKSSRKGYALGLRYTDYLVYDRPRTLQYTLGVAGYAAMERLPDFQNVVSPYTEMANAFGSLAYDNRRGTIGSVDKIKGISWELTASGTYVNRELHPRISLETHLGVPLPITYSSLWFRMAAGQAFGDRSNPFANYYFGGFGNNWIDHQDERRYAEYIAFPGLGLNAVGGRNFVRGLVDWNLPPVRFRHLGGTGLYAKWARLTAFAGGLATNIDASDDRLEALTLGGQLDVRVTFFSYLHTTLSVGYGRARVGSGAWQDEVMVSVKVL